MQKIGVDFLKRMCLPAIFWSARLEDIEVPARDTIRKFCETDSHIKAGHGLFLTGVLGGGKTSAAGVVMQLLAARGHLCLYIKADDIAEYYIKETPFDCDETMIERITRVDLLVIDDLKLKSRDSFMDAAVERVFRSRMEALRSTIVTSNLTSAQIQHKFGPLYDCFQECLYTVRFVAPRRSGLQERLKQEFK